MTRHRAWWGLLLALVLAAPLWAGEPPGALRGEALRHQVAKWIAALRSDDFAVREAARKGLKRYARQAREWIEAAADDPDPEVRRTLRALLGPAALPPPTPVRVGDFSKLLHVKFDYRGKPAKEVFADFGRRFGGSFDIPGTHVEVPVTAKAEGVPYFEGLQTLLRSAGLHMTASFSRAGVAPLVAARPGVEGAVPAVAAGPLWVRIVGRQTTVRFGHPQPAPTYALNLQIWWPPSVQVNQVRALRVEVARDEKGRAFTSASARGVPYGMVQGVYSRNLDVALHPASEGAHGSKLAALELTVPMRLRHGLKTRTTTRTDSLPIVLGPDGVLTDKLGKDGSVAFRSLEPQEGRASTWIAEVAAVLSDDVSRQSAQVVLETEGGRAVGMYLATGRSESADGVLHLTARGYGVGEKRPSRISLHWFTNEADGNVRVRFEDIALR